MRTPSVRCGRAAAGALVATAALAGIATPTALAAPSHNLPAAGNKLTTCHTTLFKVAGRLPVNTAFATQKHKHPAKALLSCSRRQRGRPRPASATTRRSRSAWARRSDVAGVTYTMGRDATGTWVACRRPA